MNMVSMALVPLVLGLVVAVEFEQERRAARYKEDFASVGPIADVSVTLTWCRTEIGERILIEFAPHERGRTVTAEIRVCQKQKLLTVRSQETILLSGEAS